MGFALFLNGDSSFYIFLVLKCFKEISLIYLYFFYKLVVFVWHIYYNKKKIVISNDKFAFKIKQIKI
jgi:hypothetical protein